MNILLKSGIKFIMIITPLLLSAQTFGIKAGVNFSNMLEKYNETTYSNHYNYRTGFHIGPTVEFSTIKNFTFEVSLLLSTKGYREKVKVRNEIHSFKTNLLYLDLSSSINPTFDFGKLKAFGIFGIYTGIGLGGKDIIVDGEHRKIKFGYSDDSNFTSIEIGLKLGTGLKIKVFKIDFAYNLGLSNIAPHSQKDAIIKNRVFAISLGYNF